MVEELGGSSRKRRRWGCWKGAREDVFYAEGEEHHDQIPPESQKTARKRLVAADGTVSVRGQELPNLAGKVANTVLLLENTAGSTSGGVISTPEKVPTVKRRKQDGEMDTTSQAASIEEGRGAR